MRKDIENEHVGRRLYYRPREVAALTGLGLRTVYEGIGAGWIPSRKIGNARLIPANWLTAASDREADRIADERIDSQSTSLLWATAPASARAIAARATRIAFNAMRDLLTQRSATLAL